MEGTEGGESEGEGGREGGVEGTQPHAACSARQVISIQQTVYSVWCTGVWHMGVRCIGAWHMEVWCMGVWYMGI